MYSVSDDRGHGRGTLGKGSPDGVFKEWAFNADVAEIFTQTLIANGVDCVNIVTTDEDMSLDDRIKIINALARKNPDHIHISFHTNAAGMGDKWYDARGWQVHTCLNPGVKTRRLANCVYDAAVDKGFRTRPESPGMHFRPKNLKILRETTCPAILLEQFFMDNKEDLAYLLSPMAIYDCAEVAANGVLRYLGIK